MKEPEKPGQPEKNRSVPEPSSQWDFGTHGSFYEYYAQESLSPQALRNFTAIRDNILRVLEGLTGLSRPYDVADIGCGAGTQSFVWAQAGHRVHGIDVNAPLVGLARERSKERGFSIDFRVGSASGLPWADQTMDICLAAELIEHVADWKGCLAELRRVLRPGGALFLATNNVVWPRQKEFNLPLYSWYPGPVKRHYEHLARTTRPELANFATYPAVNWFTYYDLQRALEEIGFDSMDQFALMDAAAKSSIARRTVSLIRTVPALRRLAVLCAPSILLLAIRNPRPVK